MRAKTLFLAVVTSLFTFFSCSAQQRVTVEATSSDISYNLDLQAVANLFGEAYDLENFEMRLNDPNNPISNLDLNNDGYVDYLRVIEATEKDTKLVVIQAVLDKDVYQDVATIVVDRQKKNTTYVQVIGNSYIYGPDYCFEPVYVIVPPIYSWFWSPRRHVWCSPYYWGYYPSYYRYYSPYPVNVYVNHIHVSYYNTNITYNYTSVRNNRRIDNMSRNVSRNDYATRYPDRSFSNRNSGMATNRSQLRDIQPGRGGSRDNSAGRINSTNQRDASAGRTTANGT
ncbi:MAG: hypothetical protein FWF72_01085, partial [Paludibacter sp.]|nr:hypothetical protein [Paludibacter sp.]